MKAKSYTFLLLMVGIIALAASTITSSNTTGKTNSSIAPDKTAQNNTDPPGTINGAAHPEMIPDRSAYLMLFRLIANRPTVVEQQRIRAYIRSVIGLGRQENFHSNNDGDNDINALIAAAEEFNSKVSPLDSKVMELKDRSWPNPTAGDMEQLALLQQQKEALVDEIASSLPRRLSANGMARLSQHINQYVKRRVKLIPEPTTPPGGTDWQPGLPVNGAHLHH